MTSNLPVFNKIPPLDEGLYDLKQEEVGFFKTLTGIQDDDELKRHIIDVQTKAYQVMCYACIRHFNFARGFSRLKIFRLPAYKEIFQLRDKYNDAILLDVGCCFGNDLRKAVLDGWPAENVIGTDIETNTFPAGFVGGDIFKNETIEPSKPLYADPSTVRPVNLKDLRSLTPLQGHVSVIHASSVFHLFNEELQTTLAKRHCGLVEKGWRSFSLTQWRMFCHSPETWKALWEGQVFKEGSIRVEVVLDPLEISPLEIFGEEKGTKCYLLVWSVTRL
ncbi:hypothetical protein NP233_g1603 [Leucocoprinus birnbaumii]|uniref:Methyltransferase domain-containing protein n=1 Tax=Leucocoprinus birnbaumii TaxID=56174 RepID=A0AAD5VZP8_9AGAR|nr:hypothetical protein NP233_g1603 [Leucocoprinus birnbaumii]